MTLREVLQIEVWSRKTSRKIFVVSGILIVVLILGLLSLYEVETRWLTARERSTARNALKQVDALQSFGSLSDQEFKAKSKRAEIALSAAERAAFTARDKQVAFLLSTYLEGTRTDRDEIQMALSMWERHIPDTGSTTEFRKKIDLTGTEIRSATRLQLHKILD